MAQRDSEGFTQWNARFKRAGKSDSTGFTIPELLVATSVFSLVLAGTMAIFFLIGHLFFKGVSITQTQQTAKKIVDSISSDIGGADSVGAITSSDKVGVSYLCIDTTRYTFFTNPPKEVNFSQHDWTNNFGLVRDTMPPDTDCGDPFSTGGTPINTASAQELLGNLMRLSNLTLNCDSTFPICDIAIYVAYGDNDLLNSPNSTAPTCISGLSVSKFCSVTNLSTTISKGF